MDHLTQRRGGAELKAQRGDLSERIIGAAIEVHRELGGPGLLESVYEEAFVFEMKARGLEVLSQVEVPVIYKGEQLKGRLRIDLLVNDQTIVEVKAVSTPNPIFESQLLTYLRVTSKPLGLLINFGLPRLVDGISRVIHSNPPLRASAPLR